MIDRLARIDLATCEVLNRINRRPLPARLFAAASRLGDGWVWGLMAVVLIACRGLQALPVLGLMLATALAGLLVYRRLKGGTRRPRPCEVAATLCLTVAPLDRFSFPSGHTLHAVAFTILLCWAWPALMPVVVPMCLLVAASRPVLGLHYPSDVLVGAGIGGLLATGAISAAQAMGIAGG